MIESLFPREKTIISIAIGTLTYDIQAQTQEAFGAMMHAILIHNPGPDGHLVRQPHPIPQPASGEVRIRVAFAALNRADIFQRQGTYPAPADASPIPGLEVSGWVDALGDGVTDFTIGQEVCALTNGGAYAEYVCVPAGQAARIPAGWSLEHAACLPEAALTVWLAAIETGGAQAGDTVLIQGGASGIGAIGIPLLKAMGMRVLATASTKEKCAWCIAQGADAAFPYHTDKLPDILRQQSANGIAVVVDMLGSTHLANALKALRPGGRLVSLAFLNGTDSPLPLGALLMKNLQWSGITLRSQNSERKASLTRAITGNLWPKWENSPWRPAIDQAFTLENAQKAQNRMEERLHLGKILLRVGA
jgi:NADPH2:quinone reductase